MTKQNLLGPDENKEFLIRGFNELVKSLPCSKKFAIAKLHFELGHCTDYVRTELIDTFIEIGLIKYDQKSNLTITPLGKAFKQRADSYREEPKGELPTDSKGNHIRGKSNRKKAETTEAVKPIEPSKSSSTTELIIEDSDSQSYDERMKGNL